MADIVYKIVLLGLLIWAVFAHRFLFSLPSLVYWWIQDIKNRDPNVFNIYGLRLYCGRQGSGKTMGIVHDLEEYRRRFPKVKIYTNFGYRAQTASLSSLNDLINPELLNGTDGVIFAIDEIQNEFSSSASRDFPESLLSQITPQRKATSLLKSIIPYIRMNTKFSGYRHHIHRSNNTGFHPVFFEIRNTH